MIERMTRGPDNVVAFKLSGTLHDADYEHLVPVIDAALERHDKVRLLAWFHDFHGWTATAVWDDMKFDAKHFTKFERIALVGEKKWQEWMSAVCKPFTSASVKYFDASEVEAAWKWIESA